jgi:hypothetical protein
MRSLSKVIVFLLISLNCVSALSARKLKARYAKVPLGEETYIYIDEKTPDYIVKKALSKRIDIAFFLKGSNAEWIADKIPLFKNSSPIVFVNGNLSELERGYLNQLAKLTDFRIKIYCFGDNCTNNVDWKHSLIKNYGTIYWKKDKKENNLYFKKKGKTEKAKTASVTDMRDFIKTPVVNGCVYLKKHKMAFLSLDSKIDKNFYKNADFMIIYSDNEKKLNEFIEKNF